MRLRGRSSTLNLLPFFVRLLEAQHNAPLGPPAGSSYSSSALPFGATVSPALPSATDHANYAAATTVPSGDSTEHNVLNYYFLLLAVFVIVIAILYITLARKRKRRFAQAATRRQSALAADLERWPGGGRNRWGAGAGAATGRWHVLRTQPKPEEGLNERGEAPPAYVAKPQSAVHATSSHDEATGEAFEMTGKPPDYEDSRHNA